MMRAPMCLFTDANLTPVGDPFRPVACKVTKRFRAPDSGTVTVPARPEIAAQLGQPGYRLVVMRDDGYFSGGPIEVPGDYAWEIGGADSEPGTYEIGFADDSAKIAGYVTYPTPANDAENQTVADQYVVTNVNAEQAMRALVNVTCGPGAIAARRIPGLALDAVAGVGAAITYSTRYEDVGDALRSMAIRGGELGYRTRQIGSQILFGVYAPRDLSASVRFSRSLRNLLAVRHTPAAPTATTAIVAGQGDGAARTIKEVSNAAALSAGWWRIEKFIDQRNTNDATELLQAGNEALVDGSPSGVLKTVTVDTEAQAYGVAYDLGDIVTVEVRPGLDVADVVRQVEYTYAPKDGEKITAIVGTQEATNDPDWLQFGRALASRLADIERRK